ncbi:MAG: FAD-dependent thymidylate synthase [Candidatus Thorarchaeota archaeon]
MIRPKTPTYIDVIPLYLPTDDDLIDAAVSGHISRLDKSFNEIRKDYTVEHAREFLKKLIELGHTSVLEHLIFKFLVSGSRVYTHEQVRHRMASYTQKSLRVPREFSEHSVVIPEELHSEDMSEWLRQAKEAFENYQYWVDKGYSVDVARYKLTQEWRTPISITINARSLRNFFSLRLYEDAHFEIRDVAKDMLHCIRVAGLASLFEDLDTVP